MFCTEIIDNLYLGSVDAANLRFDAVVSVLERNVKTWAPRQLYLEAHDQPDFDLSQHFEASFRFIEMHLKQNHLVLVHCVSGVSRSATIVAHYLMKKNKWGYTRALDLIKEKRPQISPNRGFVLQLKKCQNYLQ